MEPFVVDDCLLLKQLNRKLEEVDAKKKAEQFTLTQGGLFLKTNGLKLG